ncbi:hypothetical protein PAAG_04501 [Paracoccidioides lutzii Pb01]|uniref:Uncharacterized protein n=1 Tax=Paracoccidioides lutzii (strain ATCC MYA-826 / Pb01) TaxID=502779 RepID=C1H157_PARBA|nr:hypothetical protein PAAG_04501 [Paracoccidioides lutzii Pb01]EEH33451.2 hypothetical protein PAAG_04501 [Paracoccidioides lutzii Pb01]
MPRPDRAPGVRKRANGCNLLHTTTSTKPRQTSMGGFLVKDKTSVDQAHGSLFSGFQASSGPDHSPANTSKGHRVLPSIFASRFERKHVNKRL